VQIAVTGASGFIGRALAERLRAAGHTVAPLHVRQLGAVPGGDAVVHLAGETVVQRWTAEAKKRIRASRVDGTIRLVNALASVQPRPAVFISASAIGIYGPRGDEILTESSAPGADFLAEVCVEWEKAAGRAAQLGMRVVTLRGGIVLGRDGGVLARLLPMFRRGFGGRLGNGRQWMSWIHREDLLDLIQFALRTPELAGAVNATAPEPVRNADLTATLARLLRRPAFLAVPALALRLAYGEMAGVLLGSQRVLPQAARQAGFEFRYPTLEGALGSLLA